MSVAVGAVIMAATLALATPATARSQSGASVGPGETATVDSISVVNISGQPANVALANGVLDVALPIGVAVQVEGAECMAVVPAPNFARCRVAPGAQVTLGIVGVQAPPLAAPPAAPPQPQAEAPFPPPPMALARAGTGGLATDEPSSYWAAAALAGYGALLLSSAIVLRRRKGR